MKEKTEAFFKGVKSARNGEDESKNPYGKFYYEQHVVYQNKDYSHWIDGYTAYSNQYYQQGFECAYNGGSIEDNPVRLNKFEPFSDDSELNFKLWIEGFSDYKYFMELNYNDVT